MVIDIGIYISIHTSVDILSEFNLVESSGFVYIQSKI